MRGAGGGGSRARGRRAEGVAHNGYSNNGGGRALGLNKSELQQEGGGGRVAAVQGAVGTRGLTHRGRSLVYVSS